MFTAFTSLMGDNVQSYEECSLNLHLQPSQRTCPNAFHGQFSINCSSHSCDLASQLCPIIIFSIVSILGFHCSLDFRHPFIKPSVDQGSYFKCVRFRPFSPLHFQVFKSILIIWLGKECSFDKLKVGSHSIDLVEVCSCRSSIHA